MIGLLAYLAIITALAALLCGHVGEPFPPFRWWRVLRARRTAAPQPPAARTRRPVPSWAHTQPYDYEEAA